MIYGETFVKIIDAGYKITKDLYIFRRLPGGNSEIMRSNGEWQTYNIGEHVKPTLELDPETLQQLADVLSENGFKPEKGFLSGKIEATEKHLEDMRRLVFEEPQIINVEKKNERI